MLFKFKEVLLNEELEPERTRDALKTLVLSIRIQDTRLLVGEKQEDQAEFAGDQGSKEEREDPSSAEQSLKQAVGRVELTRLLYLLPYFMQQFLAPASGA